MVVREDRSKLGWDASVFEVWRASPRLKLVQKGDFGLTMVEELS